MFNQNVMFNETHLQKLIQILPRNSMNARPGPFGLDRQHVEPRHDTKVTASALQRPEEIRVMRAICLGEGSICQDDLVVDDAVAGPSDLVAVEVDAAG